jgi:hypothetical protein
MKQLRPENPAWRVPALEGCQLGGDVRREAHVSEVAGTGTVLATSTHTERVDQVARIRKGVGGFFQSNCRRRNLHYLALHKRIHFAFCIR